MELKIENMTCGGCARAVTRAIESIDAAAKVEINPTARTVKIDTSASRAAFLEVLDKAGYPAAAA